MDKIISAIGLNGMPKTHKKLLFYGALSIVALVVVYIFFPDRVPESTGCLPLLGMAGSRKWFVYTTDAGTLYGLNLDESNTEALNAGNNDVPNTGVTVTEALPRNIKPRRVFYKSPDGKRTISCVALTPAVYVNAEAGQPTIPDPLSSGTLNVYSKSPEKITVIRGLDSGITDGDDS